MRKPNTAVGTAWECYNQLVDPVTYTKQGDKVLRSIVRWFFSKRAVQEELADILTGNTPLCRVMRDAVREGVREITIDVDAVEGLDRHVNNAIDEVMGDLEIDAEQIKHLDRFVEDQLEEFKDEVAESVIKELVERLRG